jgi:hypothetical protein
VDSATVIEIGDLVYLETDDARPASAIAYTTLAGTQESFHDKLLGVSMQRSRAGETAEVRVATEGVFEFDAATATFELGERVGIDDNPSGTALEDQKVIAVVAGSPQLAIGKVAKRVAPAGTTVLVEIRSTVMADGPQAVA